MRPYFSADVFAFLRELAANNNRDWFQANKERFEQRVREPILRFIEDFAPRLSPMASRIRPNALGEKREAAEFVRV